MRRVVPLLFLSAVVAAEDSFTTDLEAFTQVKGLLTSPGGKDRIQPALDKLVASGDARAVEPLARYLVETITSEDATQAELRKLEQRSAETRDTVDALDKEIRLLGRKLEEGDRSVAPEFEKLLAKRKQAANAGGALYKKLAVVDRTIGQIRDLRQRVAAGVAKILGGLEGDALVAALGKLRAALDIATPQQVLFLLEILRESRQAAAAPHLIAIIDYEKIDPSVRVAAVVALGRIRTPEAYAALVRIAESDEALRPQIVHALGMAAAQQFTDLAQAKAWVAKQG